MALASRLPFSSFLFPAYISRELDLDKTVEYYRTAAERRAVHARCSTLVVSWIWGFLQVAASDRIGETNKTPQVSTIVVSYSNWV
jgi:hypothetical protein